MSDPIKVNFNADKAKSRIDTDSSGKVSIHIKLSKEEAEGYKSWRNAVRPEVMTEKEFVKLIFFHGMEAINEKLTQVAKLAMENMDKNDLSGTPQEEK